MALISQTASLYYAARKTQILHVEGNLEEGQKRWRSVIVNARPPSEAAAVSTDPLTKEDLIGYFASGCKPKENWRIGIEHERFGFDLKTLRPMKYEQIAELLNGIAERFGWDKIFEGDNVIALKQGNQSIALEPGGQFEHSGAPLETLHQIHAEVDSHLYQVQSVLKQIGIGLLDIGYQPKWEIKDIPLMPKERYQVFLNYMPKVGLRGIDSMFRTCSVQVNLDFSSETDMIRKLRASLALQPIATALFANSPFTEGKPNGFLCTRSGVVIIWSIHGICIDSSTSYYIEIYTNVDKDRTGMLPFVFHDSFGFERYVDYALDIPMYFVYRNKNYFDCTDMTFREFMAGKRCCIPGEVIPTISDWEMHLGTIYPEVRLRKYLEMRGAGSGPWKTFCGLPAFWTGLLYDEVSLQNVLDMIADWTTEERQMLRDKVPKTGLKTPFLGGLLQHVAENVVKFAKDGLERRGLNESGFLDGVVEVARTGVAPAEKLLQLYYGEWGQNIDPVFEELRY